MASLKYLDPTTGQYVQIPFRPTAQVISVNGYDGIVNLHTSDIIDLTTDLAKKVNEPANEGTAGQVLTTDGAGNRSWTTVGGGGGGTIDGALINGTAATITNKKIIIPAADTTKYGVVKVDEDNGITVDSGVLQFTDDAREILDAAASDVVAAKYVATSSYVVGDVVTYGEEVYVCKAATTGTWDATKWKKTNEQNELMNMMTQMFTALGLSCSKTWDATNNKVDYGFTING